MYKIKKNYLYANKKDDLKKKYFIISFPKDFGLHSILKPNQMFSRFFFLMNSGDNFIFTEKPHIHLNL